MKHHRVYLWIPVFILAWYLLVRVFYPCPGGFFGGFFPKEDIGCPLVEEPK